MHHAELNRKLGEMRELQKEIRGTRRELVPLTTGAIIDIKRKRSTRLREQVGWAWLGWGGLG